MANADKRNARRMDQVDRRSQVGVSRAMRARDASRPSTTQIAEALERINSTPLPPRKPTQSH